MEGVSLSVILGIVKEFGPFGIVFVVWWLDSRQFAKILAAYRADTQEQRRMYENNIVLVEDYQKLVETTQRIAENQQTALVRGTEAQTKLCDLIVGNQYCPNVRLEKRAKGKQE